MKTLSVLIVDDEARARRTLSAMINDFCEHAEVVDAVGSVQDAIEVLNSRDADVVLLDVSMPEQDGFVLAEHPAFADQPIVFVTAHAEHAVAAFRVNAVDYLLKPVNIVELQAALNRVRDRLADRPAQLKSALRFYAKGEHHLVSLAEVLYLQADGSYTYVVTADQRYMVSKGLKELGIGLEGKGFFRTHRSYLVNLQHVQRVGQTTIHLTEEMELPLSRYRRTALLEVV